MYRYTFGGYQYFQTSSSRNGLFFLNIDTYPNRWPRFIGFYRIIIYRLPLNRSPDFCFANADNPFFNSIINLIEVSLSTYYMTNVSYPFQIQTIYRNHPTSQWIPSKQPFHTHYIPTVPRITSPPALQILMDQRHRECTSSYRPQLPHLIIPGARTSLMHNVYHRFVT